MNYEKSGIMIGAFSKDGPAGFPWQGEPGIKEYEKLIGRKLASVMWYVTWDDPFPAQSCQIVRGHGSIPHITWELFWPSRDPNNARICAPDQTGLDDVLAGKHNAYIDQFAMDVKNWGGAIFIRFLHEFNGNWYVWSGNKNGRENGGPQKVKQVWRYVVDRFRALGVTNVKWVWCPHAYGFDISPESWNGPANYWPGEDYVDWLGIDAYNWYPEDPWGSKRLYQDFNDCFADIYNALLALTHKPIMIAEMGTGEFDYNGITKTEWIAHTFARMKAYPWIKMYVWFHIKKELDWRVNSSPAALAAFQAAMADPCFLSDVAVDFDGKEGPILAP
jgi:endoglucanase